MYRVSPNCWRHRRYTIRRCQCPLAGGFVITASRYSRDWPNLEPAMPHAPTLTLLRRWIDARLGSKARQPRLPFPGEPITDKTDPPPLPHVDNCNLAPPAHRPGPPTDAFADEDQTLPPLPPAYARCQAYTETGRVCRQPAVAICPARGIAVCQQHNDRL